MTSVRLLVGTAKGGFVLRSDGARREWSAEGPLFGGWQVMDMVGSPADPDRIWASTWTDWHGQVVQRSDDGGRSWATVGNEFAYRGEPGTHPWYDGSPHPWEFERVWHFQPSPDDPDTIGGLLDALEARCPALRGTVRHHDGSRRRDLIRFYAGGRDLSHEPLETPLPEPVLAGEEIFHVVGAIAGG